MNRKILYTIFGILVFSGLLFLIFQDDLTSQPPTNQETIQDVVDEIFKDIKQD